MAASKPVETKVAAGGSVATLTGMISWILVTYVPAFHSGLPGPLSTFLPYMVSSVLGTAAAWLAPHTVTAADAPAPAPAAPAAGP